MKKLILILILIPTTACFGQNPYVQLYYNSDALAAFTFGHISREVSEKMFQANQDNINNNFNSINTNLAKVITAKEIVYNSLVNVNGIINNGRKVKMVARLGQQIVSEANRVTKSVVDAPKYAPFAHASVNRLRIQAVELADQVTQFILKSDRDLLMSNAMRDKMLNEVIWRLRMIRSSLFGIAHSINQAKMYGVIMAIKPIRHNVFRDRMVMRQIISDYKRLKR